MKKTKLTNDEIKKIKRLHRLFMNIEGEGDEAVGLTPEEKNEYVELKTYLQSVLPLEN